MRNQLAEYGTQLIDIPLYSGDDQIYLCRNSRITDWTITQSTEFCAGIPIISSGIIIALSLYSEKLDIVPFENKNGIKNKLVRDCTIEELLIAVRAKLK